MVIGGVALTGGEGSVYGMFVGAFILGVLSNGIVLLGVQSDYTEVVIGAIVILAASLDVTLRRRESSLPCWASAPRNGVAASSGGRRK